MSFFKLYCLRGGGGGGGGVLSHTTRVSAAILEPLKLWLSNFDFLFVPFCHNLRRSIGQEDATVIFSNERL